MSCFSSSRFSRFHATLALLFGLVVLCHSAMGQTNIVWNPGTGFWGVPGNWDLNAIPNNGSGIFYNVFIDNDTNTNSVVTIQAGQTYTIDSLTIGAGDTLNLEDNSKLIMAFSASRPMSGQIHNSGTINLNSVGNATDLVFDNGTFTLDGGGVISLNHPSARLIDGIGAQQRELD